MHVVIAMLLLLARVYCLPIELIASAATDGDSSGWKTGTVFIPDGEELFPVQMWVSETTLYFIAIEYSSPTSANIRFLNNITIPSGLQTDVVLFSQYQGHYQTGTYSIYLLWVPRAQPNKMFEFEFSYSPSTTPTEWNIHRQVALQNVPTTVKWQKIFTNRPGETPMVAFLASIDYLVLVNTSPYGALQWMSTHSIPSDPYFSVDTVTGAGYTPDAELTSYAGPVYVARSVNGNITAGGDIALFNCSDTGGVTFDHIVYLLQGTQTSFLVGVAGYSLSNLVWLSSAPSAGTANKYMWLGDTPSLGYFEIPWTYGDLFGPASCSYPFTSLAAVTSGDPNSPGYTVRSIFADQGIFQQVDTLDIPNDPIPTMAVPAIDYHDQITNVGMFGLSDPYSGDNKLSLINYAVIGKKRSPATKQQQITKFVVSENILHVQGKDPIPPTCELHPSCGPKIGLKCPNPNNCFLDIHQFYCCEECPDGC